MGEQPTDRATEHKHKAWPEKKREHVSLLAELPLALDHTPGAVLVELLDALPVDLLPEQRAVERRRLLWLLQIHFSLPHPLGDVVPRGHRQAVGHQHLINVLIALVFFLGSLNGTAPASGLSVSPALLRQKRKSPSVVHHGPGQNRPTRGAAHRPSLHHHAPIPPC